jgi:hypothetical protein
MNRAYFVEPESASVGFGDAWLDCGAMASVEGLCAAMASHRRTPPRKTLDSHAKAPQTRINPHAEGESRCEIADEDSGGAKMFDLWSGSRSHFRGASLLGVPAIEGERVE